MQGYPETGRPCFFVSGRLLFIGCTAQNPARRTETPLGDAQEARRVNCTPESKNGSQGQLKPFGAVSLFPDKLGIEREGKKIAGYKIMV